MKSLETRGASYVVVKASEGSGYEDPCKDDFASQTLAMGVRLGFYHFAWPSANGVGEEVDTFDDERSERFYNFGII